MPSFTGGKSRCCRRSWVVLASDGHFRVINGMTGTQLSEIEYEHSIAGYSPVRWLSPSRFVQVSPDAYGYYPSAVYCDRTTVQDTVTISFDPVATSSTLHYGYDTRPDGTHCIYPAAIDTDVSSYVSVRDIDGTELYQCDIPVDSAHVRTLRGSVWVGDEMAVYTTLSSNVEMLVYDDTGTLSHSWGVTYGSGGAFRYIGSSDGIIFVKSTVRKIAVDGTESWENADISGAGAFNPFIDAGGLLCVPFVDGTDFTVYRVDPADGTTLESYVIDESVAKIVPDPFDPDIVFMLYGADSLSKYNFVTSETIWSSAQNSGNPYPADMDVTAV